MTSPEDILSTSCSLYYPQILISQEYRHESTGISVSPADTSAANWALQADSIWMASIYLADHLNELPDLQDKNILELGAGAGLPGIALAKLYPTARVCLSDFPDPKILSTLQANAINNQVHVDVWGHVWGSDVPVHKTHQFDIIIAADILWNSDSHKDLCQTLTKTLKHNGRVYLLAGLHTGRYVLERFLERVLEVGFVVDEMYERRVDGQGSSREWKVDRVEEEESERRRWLVWLILKRGMLNVEFEGNDGPILAFEKTLSRVPRISSRTGIS